MTPRLPPREPGVSVRLPPADVPEEIGNPQRDHQPEGEPNSSRDIHCSAPSECHRSLRASCGPYGAQAALAERIRCALLLDLFIQPLLELLGRLDGDESAHPRMSQAAELRA